MNRFSLFETPIWGIEIPWFKEKKEQIISGVRKVQKLDPKGVNFSNYNGYQSDQKYDILNSILHPEFDEMFNFIGDSIVNSVIKDDGLVPCDIKILGAWININARRDAINAPHTHDGVYSGVVYLHVPPKSGSIVFYDGSAVSAWVGNALLDPNSKHFGNSKRYDPCEGQVLIWRSYYTHYVIPNQHDDERISIAFNVGCIRKK